MRIRQCWLPAPAVVLSVMPPAAAISLFTLPLAALRLVFAPVRLAGDALPRRVAPLTEFVNELLQLRQLLQCFADGLERVAEFFDSVGNALPKSFSKLRAKFLQISSALCSFAFTLLTALAISCFAVAS